MAIELRLCFVLKINKPLLKKGAAVFPINPLK
jgi:hypothetical protein